MDEEVGWDEYGEIQREVEGWDYGKWTINIEIKEGEKRKKRGKMKRGKEEKEIGERRKKSRRKTRNKFKTKHLNQTRGFSESTTANA